MRFIALIAFQLLLVVGLLSVGCRSQSRVAINQGDQAQTLATPTQSSDSALEGRSLLGAQLRRPALPDDVRLRRERELESAQFAYDNNPHGEDEIVWLGRRLAYLGRYREAIDAFSNGLALHPHSHKLLRHRGHRYITLRRFDLAINDLQRAAELIKNLPDEIEADGQPNRLNIPTSTSHTNIHYHLGLAHYLRGEFDAAHRAYATCMEFSTNDDMRVATAYWLYLTQRRLGRERQAATTLASISPGMNIIENASYHKLLLQFKQELSPDQLAGDEHGDASIDLATLGYGFGMRLLLEGDTAGAKEQFGRVLANSNWAAFGHIAAEAELARIDGKNVKSDE